MVEQQNLAVTRDKPAFQTGRIGLAVMDNAFHHGHMALLARMLCTCEKSVIAFGSSQLSGVPGHPFAFAHKKAMVEAVFGVGTFTFVTLNDIRATRREDWVDYVLGRVKALGIREPTDYYAGSLYDAQWYEGAFAKADGPGVACGPEAVYRDGTTGRALRIVNREANSTPSGRQVRELIEMRDERWHEHVPQRLWQYVEWTYPPHLRVAMGGFDYPDPDLHPPGTLFAPSQSGDTFELMDDGQWRPKAYGGDDKAEHARRGHAARAAARNGTTNEGNA